ncbi:hypothetical protein THASP1DRAFT_28562 [Thamnocephalis sphaerospora]|uniref:B30.2/SPRY domain-containing protein n=1 Tax=Thamnocephalis sphaerospora TaxID=78915 RepID=A0A4P9XTY0_9FUNG|nr:hypothetical protein THASP1DRAFT_28562 [Thamnocephalis sphaerospora]|eukprot:RKP09648.1 hypothetical protein THASP1DRAFT_28562 [Thamnocephalis sphaerospora]
MVSRSLTGRFTTQLQRLRYNHLIRQAWQAVREGTEDGQSGSAGGSDRLNDTADVLISLSQDDGHFVELLIAMVDTLPHDDPLLLTFFCHMLELIALPSTENAVKLSERLLHKVQTSQNGNSLFRSKSGTRVRINSAIIWMILAQRLAGKVAAQLFTDAVHKQLAEQLADTRHPQEQLFALLTLERFSITGQCKQKVTRSSVLDTLRSFILDDYENELTDDQAHNAAQACQTRQADTAGSESANNRSGTRFGSSFWSTGYHHMVRSSPIRRLISLTLGSSGHGERNGRGTASGTAAARSTASLRFSRSSLLSFSTSSPLMSAGASAGNPTSPDEHATAVRKWKTRELQFCANWALSYTLANGMCAPSRPVHQQQTALLDYTSAIGQWKISPDWMEVRNDYTAFATICSTCPVRLGTWYYEVTLVTTGIMQIGWANAVDGEIFECDEGIGVGDTACSLGYDGCRKLTWYHACTQSEQSGQSWKEGDVLGVWLQLEEQNTAFHFYLNGVLVPQSSHEPEFTQCVNDWLHTIASDTAAGRYTLRPAASFTSGQQACFNFGATPFRYPPEKPFSTLYRLATELCPTPVQISDWSRGVYGSGMSPMEQQYALFPPDGSFERLFTTARMVFLAFGIVYTVLAALQLAYLVRFRSTVSFLVMVAFGFYAADCYMVVLYKGVTWLVFYWTFLVYATITILLISWSKSMLELLPRLARGTYIVGVIAYICFIYSFMAMTVARNISNRGQMVVSWLVDSAIGTQYAGLILLLLASGVMLKFAPPGKPFWKNRKQREAASLLVVCALLLLHRVLTHVDVPFVEFAVFPLVGIFTLYPVNTLTGFHTKPGDNVPTAWRKS